MKQTGFSFHRIAHVTKLFEARDAYVKKSGMLTSRSRAGCCQLDVKVLKNKIEEWVVVGLVERGTSGLLLTFCFTSPFF